jgi:hypothetical protein
MTRSQLIFSLCARWRIRVKEKISTLDLTIYSSDISGKTPAPTLAPLSPTMSINQHHQHGASPLKRKERTKLIY